jgi:hypothetical protein
MLEEERVALMYGLGMNNHGTGLVLVSLVLASYPRVIVPIIVFIRRAGGYALIVNIPLDPARHQVNPQGF